MLLAQIDDRVCPDPCAGPCAGCPDRIVFRCHRVAEEAILAAVEAGCNTIRALRRATGAGDGCTCCHAELQVLLTVHAPSSSSVSMCSLK